MLTCIPQFQEEYVRQGIEGGKQAAYALRSAVAKACVDYDPDIEISAKVVANLAGLSKAMARDGTFFNSCNFKDFTLGFTQAKASFDFIDVGYGKERADSKIRGEFLLGPAHLQPLAHYIHENLTACWQKIPDGICRTRIADRFFWASLTTPVMLRSWTRSCAIRPLGSGSPSLKASLL